MTELQVLADRLAAAKSYVDVFGTSPDTTAQVTTIYRRLAKIAHPDRYTGAERDTATDVLVLLNKYRDEAETAIAVGRYGQPVTMAVITTKHAVHEVRRKIGVGDICHLYETHSVTEHAELSGLLKIARTARDDDLMLAEARSLKSLHKDDDQLGRHVPILLDDFVYHDGKGRRKANVTTWYDDDWVDLRQLREMFPGGIDPRHGVWIWRRLLLALAYTHQCDIIHGAVVPPNILILPSQHGVVIVNWCYSLTMPDFDSETKTPIKALISDYADWYPEEVTNKTNPSPATDIIMAARCMVWLLGGDPKSGVIPEHVPKLMRAWFKGCLSPKQIMRPQHAGALLQEFDRVLQRIGEPYHPRRWVDFVVPVGATM